MGLHADELAIDADLVRALIAPTPYADLPLRALDASGSSNALFRLGDELLVRLPRRPGGSETIAKEARWLPLLGPALPVAVPDVVTVGEPGFGYPERWSIVRWIGGRTPSSVPADDLAAVVTALRALPVPAEALSDPALRWYRGEPLAALDDEFRTYLAQCRGLDLDLDLDACARVWSSVMALPPAAPTTRWLHADLVAENLLVRDGRLVAVLDFGALTVGDPTVDLMGAWELLDAPGRARFRSTVGVEDATWQRARAWALLLAVMTFPYYWTTMPSRCASRLSMARAVLADFSSDR